MPDADGVTTLLVRGEGGHVFDMDLPAEGTPRREIFDGMVAKGWLTVIEQPEAKKPRARRAPAGDDAAEAPEPSAIPE